MAVFRPLAVITPHPLRWSRPHRMPPGQSLGQGAFVCPVPAGCRRDYSPSRRVVYMTNGTEHPEILAWIGDDHGLNHHEVEQLTAVADELAERYPGQDGQAEREMALMTAYELMINPAATTITELGEQLAMARSREAAVLAGLCQAARQLIPADQWSESEFAREARVDRMTVRKWLGKRSKRG